MFSHTTGGVEAPISDTLILLEMEDSIPLLLVKKSAIHFSQKCDE